MIYEQGLPETLRETVANEEKARGILVIYCDGITADVKARGLTKAQITAILLRLLLKLFS